MTDPLRDVLATALGDLFPHYQREKWPFTAVQAADAILSDLAAEGWVLVADPWPMDLERLRDWWDSLSELDQFNAYRIEKSNADALASEDRPSQKEDTRP